jgi:hypothetical protein
VRNRNHIFFSDRLKSKQTLLNYEINQYKLIHNFSLLSPSSEKWKRNAFCGMDFCVILLFFQTFHVGHAAINSG